MDRQPLPEAAFAAFDALAPRDHALLRLFAHRLIWGTEHFHSVDELIGEALVRVAKGTREWPEGMAFDIVMTQSVRGVAAASRRFKKRRAGLEVFRPDPEAAAEAGGGDEGDEGEAREHGYAPSAEEAASCRQRVDRLTRALRIAMDELAGDSAACLAIDAWLQGLERADMLDEGLMDAATLDAAIKRARRVVRRLLGERG